MAKEIPWKTLSEAYAFIGNSLLKPMTMTSTVGLDPAFWEAFPSFDDEAVAAGQGTPVTVRIDGEDEAAAMQEVVSLFERRFDEE